MVKTYEELHFQAFLYNNNFFLLEVVEKTNKNLKFKMSIILAQKWFKIF